MSYADELFVKMCRDILDNGTDTKAKKSARNGKIPMKVLIQSNDLEW